MSKFNLKPVGIYKAVLVAAAWYFYGPGAAALTFLAWLQVNVTWRKRAS